MMAKMFYTLDETKAALAKNEEEIKQFAREGRLREFRDGPRLMFKADQVESLKAELGGGDVVSLGPSDTGGPLGMVDSKGASGSVVSLADSTKPGGKDETAFADIGLSGSIGGVPSPGRGAPRDAGGSAAGSRAGITVFEVDDSQRVDPSAQTVMSSGVSDQVNLEGAGSGSGLLDLTRESDDTSLGAVFDELTPGGSRRGQASKTATDSKTGSGVGMAALEPTTGRAVGVPVVVEAPDPSAGAFGGMALGSAMVLAVGGFVLINELQGFRWSFLDTLAKSGMMYLLIAVAVIAVCSVVGLLVGRSSAR